MESIILQVKFCLVLSFFFGSRKQTNKTEDYVTHKKIRNKVLCIQNRRAMQMEDERNPLLIKNWKNPWRFSLI